MREEVEAIDTYLAVAIGVLISRPEPASIVCRLADPIPVSLRERNGLAAYLNHHPDIL